MYVLSFFCLTSRVPTSTRQPDNRTTMTDGTPLGRQSNSSSPTYSPTLNSRCSKILLLCISRVLWVRSRFLCLFVSILMRNNRGMADKPQNHYRTLRIYPSSCSSSPSSSSSPFHSHTFRSTIRRRIAHRRRTAAGARKEEIRNDQD